LSDSNSSEVTRLLVDLTGGNRDAVDQLLPLVYDELRRIAGGHLRGERVGHTLQATALVHEAYMKLVDQREVNWQNRAHFFGVAAQLMRRILIDYARSKQTGKRGGGFQRAELDEALMVGAERGSELLALDTALEALAQVDPQQAKIVELRFFGGLTVEETAEVIGISPATVKRDWSMAKAWLHREMAST
jgi:RNA polymerase sigma factor (TIGR02999 family)